jgi:hypothetical protein
MKKLSVLSNHGRHVARLGETDEKVCSGRDLAKELAETRLPIGEAKAWHPDLRRAHKTLEAQADKWL